MGNQKERKQKSQQVATVNHDCILHKVLVQKGQKYKNSQYTLIHASINDGSKRLPLGILQCKLP
jgi:hypothetical protein